MLPVEDNPVKGKLFNQSEEWINMNPLNLWNFSYTLAWSSPLRTSTDYRKPLYRFYKGLVYQVVMMVPHWHMIVLQKAINHFACIERISLSECAFYMTWNVCNEYTLFPMPVKTDIFFFSVRERDNRIGPASCMESLSEGGYILARGLLDEGYSTLSEIFSSMNPLFGPICVRFIEVIAIESAVTSDLLSR